MTAILSGSDAGHVMPPVPRRRGAFGVYELLTFMVGSLLNAAAYGSPQPTVLALGFLLAGWVALILTGTSGFFERRILFRTFVAGWLMAGVAAFYANVLNDPWQLHLDAGTFFDVTSSGETEDLTFLEIQVIYENALPILIWREVYNFMAELGFARERFVGVLVNVLAVALTGVMAMRMTHRMYGMDERRSRLMVLFFTSCGLMWLFAAIHIRDSMVLLAVTALCVVWIRFLDRPSFGLRFIALVAASVVGTIFFGFMRREFVFVPGALIAAGVTALLLGNKSRSNRLVAYALAGIAAAAIGALLFEYGGLVLLTLSAGDEGYSALSAAESGADSLGLKLIYDQPMPLRLILGTIYLFMYPVPFWVGFQLQSAYHLFKSFNVFFFYALTPLLLVSLRQLWSQGRRSSPMQVFVLVVSAGFTVAIAGSSTENRHSGAFLVPLFLLALTADPSDLRVRRRYRTLLKLLLASVVGVHALWFLLKGL